MELEGLKKAERYFLLYTLFSQKNKNKTSSDDKQRYNVELKHKL